MEGRKMSYLIVPAAELEKARAAKIKEERRKEVESCLEAMNEQLVWGHNTFFINRYERISPEESLWWRSWDFSKGWLLDGVFDAFETSGYKIEMVKEEIKVLFLFTM